MQAGAELVLVSSIATILFSGVISVYLGRQWYRQEVRLLTDLPLVFAISFVSQTLNMIILTLPNLGVLAPSMELFRLRSVIISGATVPVLGALLQIWAPSIQKYHNRLVYILLIYWVSIALFGVTEQFVMIMTIPVIIGLGIMMMCTFVVTWRTGRLREVRSDLMIISVLFGMASQVMRVPLISTPFFYIPDVLLTISMVVGALALTNPWYHRERKIKAEEAPQLTAVF
ncbi:MAG: hypothetical protein ACFFCT_03935 [Candidatus Odinarchaeota archaeon]